MWLGFKLPCLSETGTANFQDLCSPLRVMAADAEQPDVPPAVAPDNSPIALVCQVRACTGKYLPTSNPFMWRCDVDKSRDPWGEVKTRSISQKIALWICKDKHPPHLVDMPGWKRLMFDLFDGRYRPAVRTTIVTHRQQFLTKRPYIVFSQNTENSNIARACVFQRPWVPRFSRFHENSNLFTP